jgi:hypothetical protein
LQKGATAAQNSRNAAAVAKCARRR